MVDEARQSKPFGQLFAAPAMQTSVQRLPSGPLPQMPESHSAFAAQVWPSPPSANGATMHRPSKQTSPGQSSSVSQPSMFFWMNCLSTSVRVSAASCVHCGSPNEVTPMSVVLPSSCTNEGPPESPRHLPLLSDCE